MKQTLLTFALMLLPMLASAAVEKNGIYYNLNNGTGTAEVTKHPNGYNGAVNIPKTVLIDGTEYSVTSIGNNAFSDCILLTSITIPNSVTSIGQFAISHCTGLTSITIPSSVTSIGNNAFCECSGLTSITIPSSVTSLGDYAFANCSGLTSITIPNSITSIGWGAFAGCSGLTSITIPNSVTSIGGFAFDNCSGLTSIAIPNSVTSIGIYTFRDCSGLTSVTIPNSVTSIEERAFSGCSGLTSITIPNSVTSIGNSAFRGCSGLSSITIPNSVTSIGSAVFADCSGLTSITIPNSVTSIGNYAFSNCSGLLDFYCFAESVPTTGNYVFDSSNISNATLHVPAGSVSAYQAAEPWNQFGTIVGIEEINGVSLNKTEAVLEKGKTMTLKATITPETLADKSVKWKSSNTAVATVTSSGKVKGVKAGFATITCTSVATGEEATCKVTVGYVKLDKTEAILEKTKTMTLTPTVYPSKLEDRSVTWKSSDTKVATVTSSGKVKGVKAGMVTITCTSNATGLSTNCQLIVGYVKLDKTEATLEKGETVTLTPTVYPSKLTDRSVTWKSSDETIAEVTGSGEVKGVNAGIATITSTSNATGLSTTCMVTVSGISLDKTEAILEKGKTMTLKPTFYPEIADKSVTWKSSNTAVATVSSTGKVKGVKAGIVTITCTSVATGATATCNLTVGYVKLDKTEAILEKFKTMTLEATAYPSKLEDRSVTWESSDTKIATVTSSGEVEGIKAGTATITCTSNATGLSTTCKVTVGYVKLDKTEVAVKKNKTVTLTPTVYPSKLTDRSVTWKSSDETIATVTSDGKVKGVKYGTATITCTSNATGLSTTCTVTVGTVYLDIAEVTIHNGGALTLTSTVYPNTLTDKSVTWKSSDNTIATVTSDGKVKGVNVGTATITCTSVATGLSSTCKVTVIEFAGARFVYEDDDEVTGIENLDENPVAEEPFDVYDLHGRKVLHRVTSLDGLPAGVYIVNGKKIMKK